MIKSLNNKCVLAFISFAVIGSGTCCYAQDYNQGAPGNVNPGDYNSNSLPNGGLRGPQDIINSTNALDSYGNPRTTGAVPDAAGGGYGYNPNGASEPAPGSIRPFTGGSAGNYGGAAPNQYQASPPPYGGAPGGYPGGAAGGYPGSPVGYQGQGGVQQPPPSYKHHHHHGNNQYANNQYQDPAATGSSNVPPGGLNSGPPNAAYTPGSHHSGNDSLAGAAVGVPDRAAKSAVGVSGKAAKEVIKAIF